MDNLLFGSIGVLTETSELQRQALNQALSDFGTGLHWNIATYCQHLTRPGGYARLISAGLDTDTARRVHNRKQDIFADLVASGLTPRPGIVQLIEDCHQAGIRLGFITTTTPQTLQLIKTALRTDIDFSRFAVLTDKTDVNAEKPHPEVYLHALQTLSATTQSCLAIEDTPANQQAALNAGIQCILYPGEYASVSLDTDICTHLSFADCKASAACPSLPLDQQVA